MLFNSMIFICIFLPLSLAGWYLLQKLKTPIFARIFLIGMSLWFYGYYNPYYLAILVASIGVNFILSLIMDKSGLKAVRIAALVTGIIANLGALFYFKYFNFFIDNCNFILHTSISVEKIALPLGISFFTFQQISYCIERYKNNAPHHNIIDYACFVSFFPQLVAGPIVLQEEFIPQLVARKNRTLDVDSFTKGAMLFALGLAKKVLLADSLAIVVNAEYGTIWALDIPTSWIVIWMYMLELYFDFSGYCDMARGIGKMFGFELPVNFDSPLMATSVKDFWRRWHKTLSRFLMTYIYIPLGGNRRGKLRQCINLMVVFLVSGLWHGANWTFIIWGALHGIAVVFETLVPVKKLPEWLRRILTVIYVTFTFSIFRCDSLSDMVLLVKKLFAGGVNGLFLGMCNALSLKESYAIVKALSMLGSRGLNAFYVVQLVALIAICIILIRGKQAEEWIDTKGQKLTGIFVVATLFVWAVISLSQVSTFLYFNF